MENIYVISTREWATNDKYKIGKHTGTPKTLLKRYKTTLIDPIIYLFCPCIESSYIEKKIKEKLFEYRIDDSNGKKSEWVILKLEKIIDMIIPIMKNGGFPEIINSDSNGEQMIAFKENMFKKENFISRPSPQYENYIAKRFIIDQCDKGEYLIPKDKINRAFRIFLHKNWFNSYIDIQYFNEVLESEGHKSILYTGNIEGYKYTKNILCVEGLRLKQENMMNEN